jgi:uncharacterized membrane protein (UPF0182 family)
VAWGETFDEAAASLFGVFVDGQATERPSRAEGAEGAEGAGQNIRAEDPAAPVSRPAGAAKESATKESNSGGALRDLVNSARIHYDAAIDASRSGDWARYGDELDRLTEVLDELERATRNLSREGAAGEPDGAYREGEIYDDNSNS